MKAYKAAGHTHAEVAEAFGVNLKTAKRYCKGISLQGTCRKKGSLQEEANLSAMIAKYQPGFEYAGNYTGSDGTADLRCKECGSIVTRAWVTVRHKKHIRCDACYEKETLAKQEKARAEREQKAAAIAWSRYEKSIKQQTFAICKECSTLFVQTARKEVYCSDECRRRAYNNHKDRRLKGVSQDASITLRKVYEKAAGVCYLCGGMCDWDDIETREDGTMVAGDRYPSIDHVNPISLGGTHTWDNVRLAHRWCNTVKSNIPYPLKTANERGDRRGEFRNKPNESNQGEGGLRWLEKTGSTRTTSE